jgi:spermidine synthase
METTVLEQSDPLHPIEYHGTLLEKYRGPPQDWCILDTETDGECLFINNQLQSSTQDEPIYHEMLVHSLLSGIRSPKRILILGGAEGCTLREVLRWDSVEVVDQVDWDASLCEWFKVHGTHWNDGAYEDPRVTLIIHDALEYVQRCEPSTYDAVIVDLLDPNDLAGTAFLLDILKEVKRCLAPGGGFILNAGVVEQQKRTQACILADSMKELFSEPTYTRCAFHVEVPTFAGTWGFLLATSNLWSVHQSECQLPQGLQVFTLLKLRNALQWHEEFPESLRTFWMEDRSRSSKKLTEELPLFEGIDLREHYGC